MWQASMEWDVILYPHRYAALTAGDTDHDTNRRNKNLNEKGEERGATYVQSNWL